MSSESLISFQSEDIDFTLQDQTLISDWLLDISKKENKAIGIIEYILCSDAFLLEINRKHLQHDFLTDIITFPLNSSPIEANVFISVERVKENAQLYSQSFEDELHRVIVHGLLHLFSYNDKTNEEKNIMRQKEDDCLAIRSFI